MRSVAVNEALTPVKREWHETCKPDFKIAAAVAALTLLIFVGSKFSACQAEELDGMPVIDLSCTGFDLYSVALKLTRFVHRHHLFPLVGLATLAAIVSCLQLSGLLVSKYPKIDSDTCMLKIPEEIFDRLDGEDVFL